ncbi:MAG: hypothetical protein ACK4F6_19425, partial [Hylemonella sp.]
WPLVAAALYGVGSIAAFFLSSATGFLGVTAQLVGWQEYVTKGVELLAVLAALAALRTLALVHGCAAPSPCCTVSMLRRVA